MRNRILRRQRIMRWCLLVIALSILGCSISPSPIGGGREKEIELSRAIEGVSFQRGLAEHYVALARAEFIDKPDLFKDVQGKYGRAAARGNSFIDKLKFSLTLHAIDADEVARDVKRVADAVNELHAVVNPSPLDPNGGITASAIIGLLTPAYIDSIVKGALAIWKAAQEGEDKLIDDIKKELDRQRWKSWHELGSAA